MYTPPREQTVILLLTAAGQHFGLPIAVVRDALHVSRTGREGGWQVRGAVPGSSCDGRVIDVGGQRAPLIDVCLLLGPPDRPRCHGRARSVVVVQCGERWLGLLVDAVGDVVEVPLSTIVPVPDSGAPHPAIRSTLELADRTIGLVDPDHLLTPTERRSLV
jgi:chemotaxis signal transduction protein